jgi:hypothetical protein
MVLLQFQHLMSSGFRQFGTDAFRMKTAYPTLQGFEMRRMFRKGQLAAGLRVQA